MGLKRRIQQCLMGAMCCSAAVRFASAKSLAGYSPIRARITKEMTDAEKAGLLGQPKLSRVPSVAVSKGESPGAVDGGAAAQSRNNSTSQGKSSSSNSKRDTDVRLWVNPANMLEWHYTISGPVGTPFEGGLYHGRIMLPPNYPNAPPSIVMFTPSGRFAPNKRICLSASEFHPESWTPGWTIQMLARALIPHMHTEAALEIGSLSTTPTEKKYLAARSRSYRCKAPWCSCVHAAFDSTDWPAPPLSVDDPSFAKLRQRHLSSKAGRVKRRGGNGKASGKKGGRGKGASETQQRQTEQMQQRRGGGAIKAVAMLEKAVAASSWARLVLLGLAVVIALNMMSASLAQVLRPV